MKEEAKILIVDDTITYRMVLTEVVNNIPGAAVVGTASNGKLALSKLQGISVDIVLLDIEMPEMDGFETLRHIQSKYPKIKVIMVSSLNRSSADVTIKALEAGALDFIPKPENANAQENIHEIREKLLPIIQNFLNKKSSFPPQHLVADHSFEKANKPIQSPTNSKRSMISVIAIGISTGGPNALAEVIPKLPEKIGVPILIVQHMPPLFTASLASSLDKKSKLRVKEAEEGEAVLPNTVYIAPGGKHMEIERIAQEGYPFGKVQIVLNEKPPENSCRPSVDVLFRSVSKVYGKNILALIMTGMGSDGALGVKVMKEHGCYCLSQSKESCVVYGMPKAVDDIGLSDEKVPLEEISERIVTITVGHSTKVLL